MLEPIRPWNDKSQKLMHQLSITGRAFTLDMQLARDFSKKKVIRQATKMDLLDIAHNRRKGKTWFIVPPDVAVIPKMRFGEIGYTIKRLK